MKKLSLIFFSLSMCFAIVSAQNKNEDGFGQVSSRKATSSTTTSKSTSKSSIGVKGKHYNYELSVGPRAGVGVTMMSEGSGLKIYDGSGLNFGGGLAANVRFGGIDSKGRHLDGQGMFGAGVEFNYKSLSVKTVAGEDLKISYFEVPILFQLYPCINTKQLKNLYVELGPTIAGTLSSDPESIKVDNTTYKTGDIKGFDIKATIGVGYRFNRASANDGLYVNARYYLGTSDLSGNFPAKLSSAEISVGYLFKCIGTKK